jgi:hypothetical protein
MKLSLKVHIEGCEANLLVVTVRIAHLYILLHAVIQVECYSYRNWNENWKMHLINLRIRCLYKTERLCMFLCPRFRILNQLIDFHETCGCTACHCRPPQHVTLRFPIISKNNMAYMWTCEHGSTAICWTLADFSVSYSFYTVGRTPWTVDQLVTRPVPVHRTAQTQNKRTQTFMPQVGFEPTISLFEQSKAFHSLDCVATVIGRQ